MEAVRPDNLKEIVPLHTIDETEVTNQSLKLLGPNEGLSGYPNYVVRLQYWNYRHISINGKWTFSALVSYDNGQTWEPNGPGVTITPDVQSGQRELNVNPNRSTDVGHILLTVIAELTGDIRIAELAYRADVLLPF